jgi:hypothetical protein
MKLPNIETVSLDVHFIVVNPVCLINSKIHQRQFAPACRRYTNAAKDGPSCLHIRFLSSEAMR